MEVQRADERALAMPAPKAVAPWGPATDPPTPDWSAVQLPPSWVDELRLFTRLSDMGKFLRRLFGPRQAVELPADLPGRHLVPSYVLEEFHHLPNGHFSHRFSESYVLWFNIAMLGRMTRVRKHIARMFAGFRAVLDLGCGGGDLAAAVKAVGVDDVVGLDVSPYMLRQAALRHPGLRLVMGAAERTGFSEARFDGMAVCFLFHELPPSAQDAALDEIHRILAPGGRLVICEPAPEQFRDNLWQLFRKAAVTGLWWRLLARLVYEPYVAQWHERDPKALLERHGFTLLEDKSDVPFRTLVAVRS
jgi:ubiquinone/menaquinone biosynthesis C-methylase UbiE